MRCTAAAAFGCTTETTGTLNDSVCVRRAACALSRGRIPTPSASSTSTSGVRRRSRAFRNGETLDSSVLSFESAVFTLLLPLICWHGGRRQGHVCLAAFQPSVHRRKYDRHEQQGGGGSEQQAADDGAPQGCVLFAAVAEAKCHGQHADHHGERGHQHRAKPPETGV